MFTKRKAEELKHPFCMLLLLLCIFMYIPSGAQLITGYWKGKIDRKNVELKIIKNGDSITGTSYYYQSANHYARYSIKGYFSHTDNSVVWWDEVLLEAKGNKKSLSSKTNTGYLSRADFNCPGGATMYLDGKTAAKDDADKQDKPVALEKTDTHVFPDDWDYVIDNYLVGANDPQLIDSISKLTFNKPVSAEPVATPPSTSNNNTTVIPVKNKVPDPVIDNKKDIKPVIEEIHEPVRVKAMVSNEEKFISRNKKLMQEITLIGDSIELRFYDNAEVDGDSIAIFLNNKLLYEHVRLSDKPYTIKLPVAPLQSSNELVMVAENLGSIPPNTSLMVVMMGDKQYEARLESTEQSSALIRFIKK